MRYWEIINELTFQGSQCTKDCSGHKAGYNWGKKHPVEPVQQTPSPSFNKGTEISKRTDIKRPFVRDVKGRFAKQPQQRPTKKGV